MPLRVKPLFGYRVALHSGAALLGNKGCTQCLDFDIVSGPHQCPQLTSSRLSKYYAVLLLITRETYTRLSDPPVARVIDKLHHSGEEHTIRTARTPTRI